jgi:hypothetical protein
MARSRQDVGRRALLASVAVAVVLALAAGTAAARRSVSCAAPHSRTVLSSRAVRV